MLAVERVGRWASIGLICFEFGACHYFVGYSLGYSGRPWLFLTGLFGMFDVSWKRFAVSMVFGRRRGDEAGSIGLFYFQFGVGNIFVGVRPWLFVVVVDTMVAARPQ